MNRFGITIQISIKVRSRYESPKIAITLAVLPASHVHIAYTKCNLCVPTNNSNKSPAREPVAFLLFFRDPYFTPSFADARVSTVEKLCHYFNVFESAAETSFLPPRYYSQVIGHVSRLRKRSTRRERGAGASVSEQKEWFKTNTTRPESCGWFKVFPKLGPRMRLESVKMIFDRTDFIFWIARGKTRRGWFITWHVKNVLRHTGYIEIHLSLNVKGTSRTVQYILWKLCSRTEADDGFGNNPYLMVHLITLANLLVQTRLFLFSIYLQLKIRCLYSEMSTCLNTNVVQWWTHDNCSMQIYVRNLYKQWATYLVKCINVAYDLTILLR